jgi:hypothetical protein
MTVGYSWAREIEIKVKTEYGSMVIDSLAENLE